MYIRSSVQEQFSSEQFSVKFCLSSQTPHLKLTLQGPFSPESQNKLVRELRYFVCHLNSEGLFSISL